MKHDSRWQLRLSAELLAAVKAVAAERGFASVNGFIRTALENELRHGETALERTERNIAASLERLAREVRSLHTAQQAAFALTDSLARLFLTCVPEPPPDALDAAKRKARLRYQRFQQSVARNMTGPEVNRD